MTFERRPGAVADSPAAALAARRRGLRVIGGGSGAAGGISTAGAAEKGHDRRREITPRIRRRRRLATALMLLICAGIVAVVLKGPVLRLVDSRRNLASTEARLAEEEERTRSLEERKARGLTDRFVELEARRMGYVKPGEIPIVVLDASGEDESEGNGENAASAAESEGVLLPAP